MLDLKELIQEVRVCTRHTRKVRIVCLYIFKYWRVRNELSICEGMKVIELLHLSFAIISECTPQCSQQSLMSANSDSFFFQSKRILISLNLQGVTPCL